MKITLFGATGAAGRLVLERALAAGHEVTAYVRDAGKLPATARLTVIEGQLDDAAAIDGAVVGQDAVISLLGPKGSSEGLPVSKGTALIVAAMQRHGVKRLVATATPSARDPNDRFSLPFALAVVMIRTLVRGAYDDIVATAAVIRSSKLDWTLARLPMLAEPKPGATVHAGYVGDGRLRLFSLSRNALADFLLAEATDPRWTGKAPALSDKR